MAQLEGTRRLSEIDTCKAPTSLNSTTSEQLHHGEDAVWPANASPVAKNRHDQEEDQTTPSKKSVFTKVKEKAKNLRHSFSGKKKHGLEYQDGNTTPPWGVTLEDDDEDDDNPEYLGAPMYESELAPENIKHQHPQEAPVDTEKHVLESSVKHEAVKEKNEQPPGPNKQFNKSVSEKLGPTYAAAATESGSHKLAQSFSSVSGGEKAASQRATQHSTNTSPQTFDKGVSVKEYLMQKLEPGEDERALSQVISDAISPGRSPGDTGVVGKMKEAVTSFLRPEQEPSQSTIKTTNESSNNPISGSKSQSAHTFRSPLSTSNSSSLSDSSPAPISLMKTNSSSNISQKPVSATNANSSPRIPVSTNSYEVVQEGNHERILQTN